MKNKTLKQYKEQEYRIERMMLNDNFYPKDYKRYAKWCKLTKEIHNNILLHFGVRHLWENPCYENAGNPLPYEVRVTHNPRRFNLRLNQ